MRGRKPKPAGLRLIEGNPGKRPLRDALKREARLELGAAMPADLSPAARAEWPRIAARLKAAKLLTTIDAPMLAVYCEAYARWRAALGLIERGGMLIATDSGGAKLHPAVTAARHAEATMVRVLAEFGCSPASRSRAQTVGDKARDDDPFADFA